MFCREVGTTSIRGISDKNKAEIPSKKTFFWGGGTDVTGRGQDAGAASVRWGGACVAAGRGGGGGYRECGAETTQGGDSAGGKRVAGIKSPHSTS